MGSMMTPRTVDPQPLLGFIADKGGESSFDDALQMFVKIGMTPSQARDTLWRLLSDGTIEFTTDRRLRAPRNRVSNRAVG